MYETLTVETGLINLEESKRCREAHEIYKQYKPDDVRRFDLPCFQTEIWSALSKADQDRCLHYWEKNEEKQSSNAITTNIETTSSTQRHSGEAIGLIDSLKEAI